MGRQEQPLDPLQGPLARFAHDLRELRRRAGSPPYRRLATLTHYSASTLAAAASGQRLPGAAVLAAFVSACGGDPDDWERRRVHTHNLVTSPTSTDPGIPAAPDPDPAPDPAPAPAPAPDPGPARTCEPPAGAPAEPPAGPLPAPPVKPATTSAVAHRLIGRLRPPALRRFTGLTVVLAALLTFGALVPGDSVAQPQDAVFPLARVQPQNDARWLRSDADIPARYRNLIIEAGTMCNVPQVTPALIAAMLKAESDFDPALSDPDKDEYGIARWTPRVLRYYLPAAKQSTVPSPPLTPEDSIPAMGRMLCAIAPSLEGVPGDPGLNLAAAYRTATWIVQQQGAALQHIQPYLDQVRSNVQRYRPLTDPS